MFNVDVLALSECTWDSSGTGVSLPYQPHIKVMQYTGLVDKNGKEIYEGDYFKNHYSNSIFEVYHSEKSGCYRVKRLKDGWQFNLYDIGPINELEVIGNIYESRQSKED